MTYECWGFLSQSHQWLLHWVSSLELFVDSLVLELQNGGERFIARDNWSNKETREGAQCHPLCGLWVGTRSVMEWVNQCIVWALSTMNRVAQKCSWNRNYHWAKAIGCTCKKEADYIQFGNVRDRQCGYAPMTVKFKIMNLNMMEQYHVLSWQKANVAVDTPKKIENC